MLYLLIDRPKEVDLICQTLQLGLQLNLIHVGLVNILEPIKRIRMGHHRRIWQTQRAVD